MSHSETPRSTCLSRHFSSTDLLLLVHFHECRPRRTHSFFFLFEQAGDSSTYTHTQVTETVTTSQYRPVDFRLPVGGGHLGDITGKISAR